ncbi:hypothetical protein ACFXGM_20985 [Streptomyces albidoflavus]
MKAQLAETGIPVAPRRIEHVTTQTDLGAPAERSSFGVEPGIGPAPSSCRTEKRFANSGTGRGRTPFTTLHHYGVQVANWAPLGEPDGSEEYLSPVEGEPALGELGRLS